VGDATPVDMKPVEAHLSECPGCRQYQEDLLKDDQLLTSFVESVETSVLRLEGQIMNSIDSAQLDPPDQGSAVREGNWWSWVFQSRLMKAAAAAVVVLGIVLAVNLFDRGGDANFAWAQVIKQVEDAQDFICRVRQDNTRDADLDMVKYHSAEFGERIDMYRRDGGKFVAAQYLKPGDKTLYVIVHRDKSFAMVELSDEQLEQITKSSAKEIVEMFKSDEYEELGERMIDGVRAVGIEVKNPEIFRTSFSESSFRLWVDPKTDWPVKIEYDGEAKRGKIRIETVMDDFQWNPALTKKDFEMDIPADYKMIGEVGAVKKDESSAIDGLREYTEFSGGRYPSELSVVTALHDIDDRMSDRRIRGELDKDDIGKLMKIQNTCAFFAELDKEDKDPVYNGDKVGPRDFDKVLMRWRTEDDRYRVIYGDLRVEDVNAARLEKLESR
jgi:outer membrane lipoprotein-sorting protein